jgi:hypothetical protein
MTPEDYVKWYYKKYQLEDTATFEDHLALIELIEKYDIKSVFEIGTWKGWTSLMMWLHPNIERLKTIDINKDMKIDFNEPRHPLNDKNFYASYLKHSNAEFEFQDSLEFFKVEQFDMVFIDGNHDYQHVKSDSHLAFRLHPKIIVWHDYGKGNHNVVTFVNELKQLGYEIKGTKDSTIVFYEVKNDKNS